MTRRLSSQLFAKYDKMMTHRPVLTQMVTAGTLCAVGDVVAQQVFEKCAVHDYSRTVRMGSFGFFYWAPICSKWLANHVRFYCCSRICVGW